MCLHTNGMVKLTYLLLSHEHLLPSIAKWRHLALISNECSIIVYTGSCQVSRIVSRLLSAAEVVLIQELIELLSLGSIVGLC